VSKQENEIMEAQICDILQAPRCLFLHSNFKIRISNFKCHH